MKNKNTELKNEIISKINEIKEQKVLEFLNEYIKRIILIKKEGN